MKGQLWVIAAPSGGGKTTLIAELVRRLPNTMESISHTTRISRPNEIDGEHYFFISKHDFEGKIAAGIFLEYAEVFGNYYGTSGAQVDEWLAEGKDVILNIDWQGACQIMQKRPDTKGIFLLPPSLEALEIRLHKRGQDSSATIQKRMQEAVEQISHYKEFHYVIVNDSFAEAAHELEAIVLSERRKYHRYAEDLRSLLTSLGQ